MHPRQLLAVLAAAALVLSACGEGDGGDAADERSPSTATETDAAATAAPSLDDGVAAVVNGTDIPADLLEARVETAAATPEVAALLEGEEGDAARAQLRASVLSQLIVNRLVLDGAEERGLEIDDDAIAATREELSAEAGGEKAFEQQIADAGLDEVQLREELEAVTALRLVRQDLQEEAGGQPSPSDGGADAQAGADALLQQWLLAQITTADIAVAPEVGSWDATRGTVVPAGAGAPPAPTGTVPPPPSPGADG